MQIECPRCKHLQEVADHLAGQVVPCASCGEQFRMPVAYDEPPPLSVTAGGKTDGGAVTRLVLTILGFVCLGPLLHIPAVVIGHMSLGRIRRSKGAVGGREMALAGVIAGYAGLVMLVFTIIILATFAVPAMGQLQESARHDADQNNNGQILGSCQNNLKQHGLVCMMYAGENKGRYFPLMSSYPGRLMYALEVREEQKVVYPEYLSDLLILFCPSDTDVSSGDPAVDLDDHSYFYINYAIGSDESAEALADAYVAAMAAGEELPDIISVTLGLGAAGLDTIPRIREGIEQFFITDFKNPAAGAMLQ